jgi:hypothetical protein
MDRLVFACLETNRVRQLCHGRGRNVLHSDYGGRESAGAARPDFIRLPPERRRHATICAKSVARITADVEEPIGVSAMFNFKYFVGRASPRVQTPAPYDFGRILNWKILRGSHEFPGPDGGTCVNEAAIVAAGFPYTPVRRIDDCPASFSRPLALYAMCLNEIVLEDALRQELLLPFVTRLAGSADTLTVDLERVGLILQRTMADIVPDAFEWTGRNREARRCRAVATPEQAVALVKELMGQEWRGARLSGLMSSISMATEDYLAFRAIDAAQYAGTAIADVAEVIGSVGGRGAARAAEQVYRRGATILDAALKIGNRAEPIALEVAAKRLDTVKQAALSERRRLAVVD